MSISISGLAVSYGQADVIADLDLRIDEGNFFTLLGPSGCGKTTLLRTIAGFVPAARGRILFGDVDVTRLPAHKRDIGMVFQDYALFPDKTVFENVAYGLRARGERGAALEGRVMKALERVDLGPFRARKPAALSGGQRQRVALARALVIEPQVLLMDEPLSNLDARLRLQVRETIMELQREARITTVFVTHDQEESLSMSDRIGVMNKGRIEQIGSPKEIYATPATTFVADFVGAANRIPVTLGQGADATRPTVRFGDVVLRARCAGPVPNGEGVLVLRPEDLGMDDSPTTDGAASSLPGSVILRQYLGARTAYKVRLGDGSVLAVDLHGEDHDRFSAGQHVSVSVNPEKALVLAR
jgi:iron(III) transport system ATP-binding protein